MDHVKSKVIKRNIINQVIKKTWLIVLIILVFAIATFYISAYRIPSLYEAEATIFIGKEAGAIAEISFLDLRIGAQLIEDYKELIKTKTVRHEVLEKTGLSMDPLELLKRVTVRTVQDSRFMAIVIVDRDPNTAAYLANTFAEVLILKAEDVIGAKNIQIVDAADAPELPVSPNVVKNTALASFMGLMIGILIVAVRILFDTKINTQTDLEELLEVNFLGKLLPIKSDQKDLIVLEDSKAYDAELYKLVRTNLDFLCSDMAYKKILFTSTQPSEGKTTTISNIAVSFALVGKKVLLIDCDLRKPRLHKVFGVSNDSGLTNYLVKDTSVTEVIKQTDIKGLYLMTSGPKPPNPNTLLMSNKLGPFLDEAEETFDIILVDAPPLLPVADSLTLTRVVDGVVMVVASKEAKKVDLINGVKSIDNLKKPLLGVVLTKVKVNGRQYYYYE